jgi:DNA-binding NtrC family response regulator
MLVVDDCPDNAEGTARLLALDGHDPVIAHGEAGARTLLENSGPWDACMIDQWLQPGPLDGGTRLLRWMRGNGHAMPAAIITAVGLDAYEDACAVAQGMGAICVRKPCDPSRVAHVLAGMAGGGGGP